MANLIYYLPGWAGHLSTGLGKALMDRDFEFRPDESINNSAAIKKSLGF
jgi:hypothetical protein